MLNIFWTINERARFRIQFSEMRCLRELAGVTKWDRVRSLITRDVLGIKPLLPFIDGLRHGLGLPEERLPCKTLATIPDGKCTIGRHRQS